MKPGRNDPCFCGSGKKYKKCCGQDQSATNAAHYPCSIADSNLRRDRQRLVSLECTEFNRLLTLANAGRHAEVEAKAHTLVSTNPTFGLIWKALGASQLMQGKDALQALQRAAEFSQDDPETHAILGLAYQNRGRFDDAVASYRKALLIEPDHVMTLVNMGNAMRNLGHLDNALESYRRALDIDPGMTDAHNNLGNVLRELGRLDEAVRSFRHVIEIRPNFAAAHGNLGNALLELGQLNTAVESYRQALDIDPDLTEVHNNLGNALRELGRISDAVASYCRALDIEPNMPEAHNNLGNALRDSGDLDEAVASYRRAIKLKPSYAEAYGNVGDVLLQLGRTDEAVASYQRALEIKPRYAAARSNLGNALHLLGRLDDAVISYRCALEINPELIEAHFNLGNALRDRGDLNEAVESYCWAIKLNPSYAKAHNKLAAVLLDLGQHEEAVASYRRALEIEPGMSEAHNNLGNALQDLDRLDEAVECYRRAIEVRPSYADAHFNLGNALLAKVRLDDAGESYRRALALNPTFATAHTNLGIVLRLQSRTSEAEASCHRAIEIAPESASAIAFLGELHADKGEFAEAEQLFKRAISIEPNFPEAWAGIVRCRKMGDSDANWLGAAQRIVDQRLRPRQEINLRFAIGKYFDDMKDFERAFSSYQRANALTKMHASKYDRQGVTGVVDWITQTFDRKWLRESRGDAIPSERPVLVVGMPRSGTTLVEQILASHPAVYGAGELTFWGTAMGANESPLAEGETRASKSRKLGREYLQLLQNLSADALRVVDKMPANFLHLGLIYAALPNAHIIHMQRNPIDTCLSIHFQYFAIAYSYACDLEDLAHYYSEYVRVMDHWRSVLPNGTVLDVPYEGLIEDQGYWSRQMVDFLGLPWDQRCIEFHQTRRTVVTTSRWQVRQKINNASVGRWHNYDKFVGPLRRLLNLVPNRGL